MPDADETVYRLDLAQGDLGTRARTPHGGLAARANLTRTGVFAYRQPDGSTRRELRHPDEVFHPDHLASFESAPVTVDHPGQVTPENWKAHAVGHVAAGAKRDGGFVAGSIHLQDARAIAQAETGSLTEVSCGYQCGIDATPGSFEGAPYDVKQTRMRINHVAVGPRGWGRMGSDVRMRLDARIGVSVDSYVRGMTEEEKAALAKAKLDAETAAAALVKARQDAADATSVADKATAQTKLDAAELVKLRAENALLTIQNARITADANDKASAERHEAEIEAAIAVRADARRIFAVVSPKGESTCDWKHDGKSNDAIKAEIVAKLEPDMKLDGLEGPALDAVYRLAITHESRVRGANSALRAAAAGERQDAKGDPADDAREEMIKKRRDASKKKDGK